MPTSYEEIKGHLDIGGFRYSETKQGTLLTGFGEMEHYRDLDGQTRLVVIVELEERGSLVRFVCPRLYRYNGELYRSDLFQSCLMINYWSKLLQMQFDDRDGELRAVIELPVEDATLTQAQVSRCLTTLAYLIDRIDPMIRKTIRQGGIHVPKQPIRY